MFFLMQIALATPQYYILSAWKSLSAVVASQNNRLRLLPYYSYKLHIFLLIFCLFVFLSMPFNDVWGAIKMDGSFPS